jgi:hypothetical protein
MKASLLTPPASIAPALTRIAGTLGLALVMAGWMLFLSPSAQAQQGVTTTTSISPDGHYALRTWGDDTHKAEIISLPQGKNTEAMVLAELEHGENDASVAALSWSPDSRRCAYSFGETQRFTVTRVYERTVAGFRAVKLPEIPVEVPAPAKGRGWTFREKGDAHFPIRWLDGDTLLLKTWVYGYLNNKKTGDADSGDAEGLAQVRFAKAVKGKAAAAKVLWHIPKQPLNTPAMKALAGDSRLSELLANQDDALDAQWAGDQAVALFVQGNSSGDCKAVRLVELHKGLAGRITDLRDKASEAIAAYYREHSVKEATDQPDLEHQYEDWRLVSADRVAVECQVIADFGKADAGDWGARLDGVWNVKRARWEHLAFQHYYLPDQ